ncbi:hypothetical protein [Flavobacterium sp.]|uniref:hypothetical protein n=1 Tax=Flavobacterium sp. TaxID=239 RepID=UPI002C45790E|nr:hypothetical protein [Flavobacterium sp.]HSD06673.1 hypothetical protein [Flavobacterium sp.]
MKQKILFLLLIIFLFGCKKKSDNITVIKSNKKNITANVISSPKDKNTVENSNSPKFPKTGKSIEDFVLSSYEIKMQAEGFLNDDKLKDIVIILQNTIDNTDSRPTLVLLKQDTGEYRLQEISWEAVEAECTEEYGKMYDYEEISIDEERKLHIKLQGIGPIGTRETLYQYINNQLVLVGINTFNMGAGSQLDQEYNLVSGEADIEIINTMVDSMPSTHTIKKFKLKRKMLFVSDNPNTVLEGLLRADW